MTTNNSLIKHKGLVTKIEKNIIFVDIEVKSACSSCHANGYCSSFGKNEKIIEVDAENYPNIKVGEEVTVILKESLGFVALFFGYILGVVILLIFLIIGLYIFNNEAHAALLSLAGISIYYSIIWLYKDKLRKTFRFQIEENCQNETICSN